MGIRRRYELGDSLVGLNAPELPDLTKNDWINSEPLKLRDLRDKIVMLDFWTYSCVNCLRTLPYLKRWYDSYKNMGLTIIGVHTPEFAFEKNRNNVSNFVRDNEINYPVVMDNDYLIWDLYANKYWPRKFLINTKGKIVFDHIGEGGYEETENTIKDLLKTVGADIAPLPAITAAMPPQGGVCYPMTPEIYCGYERGLLGNPGDFTMDEPALYDDPGTRQEGLIYLSDKWSAAPQFLEYSADKPGGYIEIAFKGVEVNAVLDSGNNASLTVKAVVEFDGLPIEKANAGKDVLWDTDGQSYLDVREPRMYSIIDANKYIKGRLRIMPQREVFRIYAFTFGNCI